MSSTLALGIVLCSLVLAFFDFTYHLWGALLFKLLECCINSCVTGTKGRLDLSLAGHVDGAANRAWNGAVGVASRPDNTGLE